MKSNLTLFAILFFMVGSANAQNVGIGTINPQQKLHVAGGLRVDTLANGVDSGLLRHNAVGTVSSLKFTGDSTQVLRGNGTFGGTAIAITDWHINGNSGTTAANFFGTTDNVPLKFRINNQIAGRIDSTFATTAFGYGSAANTTGTGNTVLGYKAGQKNTTGTNNVIIGVQALSNSTTASSLVAVGDSALFSNLSSGIKNVAVGSRALYTNTSGTNNTATGNQALYANTNGSFNTATGNQALSANTTGNFNTATGNQALLSNTTGTMNTGEGYFALNLNTTGNANTAVGYLALDSVTTGSTNTAIGQNAMKSNATGYSNVAIGASALNNNINGINLVAIGDSSMYKTISPFGQNTAVGSKAMYSNLVGSRNTAIGYQTLYSSVGNRNTAVGFNALFANISGNENTCIGSSALGSNDDGYSNTALGYSAMLHNTSGSANSVTGYQAMFGNTTGHDNTAMGNLTMNAVTTGNFNTGIGATADFTGGNATLLNNTTVIGYGTTANVLNTIRVGNIAITSIGGFVNWSNISDERVKTNIKSNVHGLDFIMKLQPVTYNLDMQKLKDKIYGKKADVIFKDPFWNEAFGEKGRISYSGFSAQAVESAANAAGYDFSGVHHPVNSDDHYTISYADFVVPLVKAVQEQQEQIAILQKLVKDQQAQIDALKNK